MAELRYLLALSQERNFTRAAAKCFVTQQSLSAGIARLERRLGTQLVARTTRRVALTDAGRALVERVGPAVTEIDGAIIDAQAVGAGHSGRVVLGFHGPGADMAGPLLATFAREEPQVRVDVRRADFTDPTAGVLEGKADVGLVAAPIEHPRLKAVAVTEEQMVFVLPADHPLADRQALRVGDLGDEPIAEMDNPDHDPLLDQWNRYWTLAEQRPGIATAPASFTGVEEWLAAQRHGRYVTTGPASAARLYPASGVVYIPAVDLPPCTWRLLYRPDHLSAPAARLIDLAAGMMLARSEGFEPPTF